MKTSSKKRKPRNKNNDEFYVDPKEFKRLIYEYYDGNGVCSEQLGSTLVKIAMGLSHMYKFTNYTYRDEMVGDAVLKMFTALEKQKFDINSGHNPFSYFTTIAFHAFINRIKREHKHAKTIDDFKEFVYPDLITEWSETPEQSIYVKPIDHDEDEF